MEPEDLDAIEDFDDLENLEDLDDDEKDAIESEIEADIDDNVKEE